MSARSNCPAFPSRRWADPCQPCRPEAPCRQRAERWSAGKGKLDLRALTEAALLRHYNSAGLLINSRGDILQIHGRTGQYLEPAAGDAAMNVFAMAREGLRRELTTALHRAVAHKEVVHLPGLRVKTNGDYTSVDLTVRPEQAVTGGGVLSDLYLVVLEAAPPAAPETVARTAEEADTPDAERAGRIAELELELRAKEEYLQTTLEEMETANEELKSTNEEMQSVNEELQSTNEELETSKEELQSVNEELATVNAELQTKVADLSRANNDMNNLLAGTGVATLFVDHQLRITRFTPTATELIKLIATDIGRSVGDIVSNLMNYTGFMDDVRAVLKSLVPHEQEVQTQQGAWYLMRISSYRTLENVIEGAVITFIDITGRKRMRGRPARGRSPGRGHRGRGARAAGRARRGPAGRLGEPCLLPRLSPDPRRRPRASRCSSWATGNGTSPCCAINCMRSSRAAAVSTTTRWSTTFPASGRAHCGSMPAGSIPARGNPA